MNLDREIIFNNSEASEDTFLYDLHELGLFNPKKFWKLFNAIKRMSLVFLYSNHIEFQIFKQISEINRFILSSLIFHHDNKDLYKIKNYNELPAKDYIVRLDILMRDFGEKELQEDIFEDELINPESPTTLKLV